MRRTRRAGILSGLIALVAVVLAIPAPTAQAVYRGHDAPNADYPWIVGVRSSTNAGTFLCTGTLIASDMVLTAGHCAVGRIVVGVGAGAPPLSSKVDIAVVSKRIGEGFARRIQRGGNNRNDIAVLLLAHPVPATPVRLQTTEPAAGDRVVAAGWGCTSKPNPTTGACANPLPTHLQETSMRVVGDRACGRSVFSNPPASAATSLCAAGSRSTINHGDSGGPLLVSDGLGGYLQVGVTSLGSDNRDKALYAEFTSLAAESAWLTQAIDELQGIPSRLTELG